MTQVLHQRVKKGEKRKKGMERILELEVGLEVGVHEGWWWLMVKRENPVEGPFMYS